MNRPGVLLGVAHLAAIWALAVVRPTFELLEDGEAFALFRWGPSEILGFALILTLLPPVFLGAIEILARLRSESMRWFVHIGFVFCLGVVLGGYIVKSIDPQARAIVFITAFLFAGLGAYAYGRFATARTFLTYLTPAPLIVLLLLIAAPAVRDQVFTDPAPDVGSVPAPKQKPVIVLVLDELPTLSLVDSNGNLDEANYPGFAALAKISTWYPRATTVADFTRDAVPALFSGKFEYGEAPSWRSYPDSLFALLQATHDQSVTGPFPICDPELCQPLVPGTLETSFLKPLPALAKAAADSFVPLGGVRRLPQVEPVTFPAPVDALRAITGQVASSTTVQVPFVFAHVMLPHVPWAYLPSGQKVSPTAACCIEDVYPQADEFQVDLGLPFEPADLRADDQNMAYMQKQRHLLQVQYVDRLLMEILKDLRSTGLLENALLVVTADHGIAFQANERSRRISETNAVEIAGVPLFIHYPGQENGRIDPRHVKNYDLVPTIADELGTELPWNASAVPLSDPSADRSSIVVRSTIAESDVELTRAEFDSRFDRLARINDRVFGDQVGLDSFSFGPRDELVGTPVKRERTTSSSSVAIDSPSLYESVDTSAESIPVQVTGTIDSSDPLDEVVVAINGRVAATSWTYDSISGTRFAVVIHPQFLRKGFNKVDVLEIKANGLAKLHRTDEAGV